MSRRKLEELNLMDDFLLNQIMSDANYGEEFARILLGIIFQREIGHLSIIPQKVQYGLETDCHGIRLDVYLDENEAGIFDVEADQNVSLRIRDSLPKRVRFYHAKIDESALKSGAGYEKLRNVCVVFITSYDPFGRGRMVYTIRNGCTEEPELYYEDGARTIFLYTKGTKGNPPKDLQELLRYMEDTRESNVCNDSIEKLHKMVQHTKQDAKAGLAYMKWYEIKQLAQEEGELLAIIKLVKKMLQQGWDVVEIADLVERPVEWIKKVEKVVRAHPDWNEEEISHALTERPLTESLK